MDGSGVLLLPTTSESFNIMKFFNGTFYIASETLQIVLTVLVFTVLPIAVFTMITFQSSILFGLRSFVVMTGSMEPLVQTGSVVYSLAQSSYNKGDIVTFEKEKITVTHRIVDVKREGSNMVYLTKGDANSSIDSTFLGKDKIIGKVQFHFPFVGKFIFFLKNPIGFISFIAIPLIGFILIELWNIKMEFEREWEKKMYKKMKERMKGFNNLAGENYYNEVRPLRKRNESRF